MRGEKEAPLLAQHEPHGEGERDGHRSRAETWFRNRHGDPPQGHLVHLLTDTNVVDEPESVSESVPDPLSGHSSQLKSESEPDVNWLQNAGHSLPSLGGACSTPGTDCPMGGNSPAMRHGLIQAALEKGEAPKHLQYINDITVWGNTGMEVFEKGDKIIQILLEASFAIKKSKVKGPA
ncbi:hypothetical protein TURU_021637 [Turdus rufiventris]|nr:hypothetical protein TURU_021637 [Turdus rufiventris]